MDNSATSPIKEEVLNEMLPYLKEEFGNPSTLYTLGRNAKKGLDQARANVADLINADSKEIVFTSGGTESDNWAIKGIAIKLRDEGKHIITTEIEHPVSLLLKSNILRLKILVNILRTLDSRQLIFLFKKME